ncbi:uncharacterized protein DNG_05637 [Cephalotrichum gorgonifer]|uniref:Uncharacterized protein n=1 Tax=Cephalotrichum gorgonifer TaxID=2041049 RepID=A0AAE8SVN8_9PEZI|nr:uncharacterized protein DNG_05637 [Cephalotrichum gorgonifer]
MSGFYTTQDARNQAYGYESAPRAMMPNPQDQQYIHSQPQQQHQQQREQQQQYQQDQRQPPMKPASQHLNTPVRQWNAEARRERPLVQRFDNRQDYMTDAEKRKALSEYVIYRFEKALDGNETDEEGRPVRPTWRNVDMTEVRDMSKQEAAARVQKLNSEGKSASEKKQALFAPQRRHIEMALKTLERTESDPRYCFVLAQLDVKYEKLSDEEYLRDERNWPNLSDRDRERAKEYYRGKDKAGKKVAVPQPMKGGVFSKDYKKDGQKKDKKERKETVSITAFFRRQPSSGVDVSLMYREKKKKKVASARNAMQARPPNPPLESTNEQHQGASPVHPQDHQAGQQAQQTQQYYQQTQQHSLQYPPQYPQQYPQHAQKLPQQTQQAQQHSQQYHQQAQPPSQQYPQNAQPTQQHAQQAQQHSPQYTQQTQQHPQQYPQQAQKPIQQTQQAQNPQKANQTQQHPHQQTTIPHRPKTPQERSAQPPVPPLVHGDQSKNLAVIHQLTKPKPGHGVAGDIGVVHTNPASNKQKGDRSGERHYPTPSNRSSNSSLSDGVFSSGTNATSQSSESWDDKRGRAKNRQGRSRGREWSQGTDAGRSRSRSPDRNRSRGHSRDRREVFGIPLRKHDVEDGYRRYGSPRLSGENRWGPPPPPPTEPRDMLTPAVVERVFDLGKEAGKKEAMNELADGSQAALSPRSVDSRRAVPQVRQRDSWSDGEIPARTAMPDDRADERHEKFINPQRVVPQTRQMDPENYARTPARAGIVDDGVYVRDERDYRRDPAPQSFDRQNYAASGGRPAVISPIDRREYQRPTDDRLSDGQEYYHARGPRAATVRYVDGRQYYRAADDRLPDDQDYTQAPSPRDAAARPINGRQYPRAADDRRVDDLGYTHAPRPRSEENGREYDTQDAPRQPRSAGNTNFTSGEPRRRVPYVESVSDSEDERPRERNPFVSRGGQRDVYVRR